MVFMSGQHFDDATVTTCPRDSIPVTRPTACLQSADLPARGLRSCYGAVLCGYALQGQVHLLGQKVTVVPSIRGTKRRTVLRPNSRLRQTQRSSSSRSRSLAHESRQSGAQTTMHR